MLNKTAQLPQKCRRRGKSNVLHRMINIIIIHLTQSSHFFVPTGENNPATHTSALFSVDWLCPPTHVGRANRTGLQESRKALPCDECAITRGVHNLFRHYSMCMHLTFRSSLSPSSDRGFPVGVGGTIPIVCTAILTRCQSNLFILGSTHSLSSYTIYWAL
jgi:hypothetical protein